MAKKVLKKAQAGKIVKSTSDSTKYYKDLYDANVAVGVSKRTAEGRQKYIKGAMKAKENLDRQSKKGKPGYDASGFPIKKKVGGSVKTKKK